MYHIASPLPLDTVPIEHGEELVDYELTEKMIQELDAKYGIKEHIGGGMWGIAFLTHDNKVLKLTTDQLEIEAAEEIKNIKHGPFAKVYETGSVRNEINGRSISYVLKEVVTPLDEDLKILFDDIAWGWGSNNDDDDDPENEELKEKFPEEVAKIENYFNDVELYPFTDTIRSDNVGLDAYDNIVAFDARMNTGGFFL